MLVHSPPFTLKEDEIKMDYPYVEEQHDFDFTCPHCNEKNCVSDPGTLSACTHCKVPLSSNAKRVFREGIALAAIVFFACLLGFWFATDDLSAESVIAAILLAYYTGKPLYHSRITITLAHPENTSSASEKVAHRKKSKRKKK